MARHILNAQILYLLTIMSKTFFLASKPETNLTVYSAIQAILNTLTFYTTNASYFLTSAILIMAVSRVCKKKNTAKIFVALAPTTDLSLRAGGGREGEIQKLCSHCVIVRLCKPAAPRPPLEPCAASFFSQRQVCAVSDTLSSIHPLSACHNLVNKPIKATVIYELK